MQIIILGKIPQWICWTILLARLRTTNNCVLRIDGDCSAGMILCAGCPADMVACRSPVWQKYLFKGIFATSICLSSCSLGRPGRHRYPHRFGGLATRPGAGIPVSSGLKFRRIVFKKKTFAGVINGLIRPATRPAKSPPSVPTVFTVGRIRAVAPASGRFNGQFTIDFGM